MSDTLGFTLILTALLLAPASAAPRELPAWQPPTGTTRTTVHSGGEGSIPYDVWGAGSVTAWFADEPRKEDEEPQSKRSGDGRPR